MAREQLNKIFLSASIPSLERNPLYSQTADVIAIRDAVIALSTVVIPNAHLIWGGHPSITPLIRSVMEVMKVEIKGYVTLYQSKYFEDKFPSDNFSFENIRLTDSTDNLLESLEIMRRTMFEENDFKAAIFIGGMEGILTEYHLFKEYHPNALILPISSTGAASKILYDELYTEKSDRLNNDYAYMSLFKDLLSEII